MVVDEIDVMDAIDVRGAGRLCHLHYRIERV